MTKQQRFYSKRVQQGLCLCGNKAREGKTTCQTCADRQHLYHYMINLIQWLEDVGAQLWPNRERGAAKKAIVSWTVSTGPIQVTRPRLLDAILTAKGSWKKTQSNSTI